jgi:hypothetical protein
MKRRICAAAVSVLALAISCAVVFTDKSAAQNESMNALSKDLQTVSVIIEDQEHHFVAAKGEALVVLKTNTFTASGNTDRGNLPSISVQGDRAPIELTVQELLAGPGAPSVYKVANHTVDTDELLRTLRNDDRVMYAEPVYVGRFCQKTPQALTPNDQYWSLQEASNMDAIRVPDLFGYRVNQPASATQITIAVLDSLHQLTHEDLAGSINGIDFTATGSDSLNKHAYGVIGELVAKGDNSIDLCGIDGLMPEVQVLALQVGDSQGAQSDAVLKALAYCADNAESLGLRAVNCSFGGLGQSTLIENQLTRLRLKNVEVVAAAGNNGQNLDVNPDVNWFGITVSYLGMMVGGTDATGQALSPESNTGSTVAGAAPIESVMTLGVNNSLGGATGTSMAAPQFAGLVPHLVELYPTLDPFDQKARITQTLQFTDRLSGVGGLLSTYDAASSQTVVYPDRDVLKIRNLEVTGNSIALTIKGSDGKATVLGGGIGVTVISRSTRHKGAKSLTDFQLMVNPGSTILFASSSGATLERVLN